MLNYFNENNHELLDLTKGKYRVSCDIDGVVLNIYRDIGTLVTNKFGLQTPFCFNDNVKTWSMKELEYKDFEGVAGKDIRMYILSLFCDEEFMASLEEYDSVFQSFRKFLNWCKLNDVQLVLNTGVAKEIVDIRMAYLETLEKKFNFKAEKIVGGADISSATYKTCAGYYMAMDDSLSVLSDSDAKYKFLFAQPHNEEQYNTELHSRLSSDNSKFITVYDWNEFVEQLSMIELSTMEYFEGIPVFYSENEVPNNLTGDVIIRDNKCSQKTFVRLDDGKMCALRG